MSLSEVINQLVQGTGGRVSRKGQPVHGATKVRLQQESATLWFTSMLDEIDYGMLLVDGNARLTYFNHAAARELDNSHPLMLGDNTLGVRFPQDVAPFYEALAGALRGRRRLLTIGDTARRASISFVPMAGDNFETAENAGKMTLLVLGKRHAIETLTVQVFARSANLTPAETRVLEGLCDGLSPSEIANQSGVSVGTIRSQIGSIRSKTGSDSIGSLIRQVSVLPPLVSALRSIKFSDALQYNINNLDSVTTSDDERTPTQPTGVVEGLPEQSKSSVADTDTETMRILLESIINSRRFLTLAAQRMQMRPLKELDSLARFQAGEI
jgi:DNA-binding CsgD family transcriptional regulator